MVDLVERLRAIGAHTAVNVTTGKDILQEATDRIEALETALSRQCDNMAFVLNKATLPDQWYCKFTNELNDDRTMLAEAF